MINSIFVLLLFGSEIFTQNFKIDGKYRFDVYSGLSRIDIENHFWGRCGGILTK